MIEIVVNNNEQLEHTKVITPPLNMNPVWKEVLSFDILKPNDEISIQIINQFANQKEILAEKRFFIGEIGNDESDPLHELKTQRRIEDILLISNMEGETIGQIKYQATWIYNKSRFLSELLSSMKAEKEDLIEEIKAQDAKMQIISKPFGGYRNILEIDDIHFEDAFLTKDMKEFLKVTDKEQEYNITFNMVANKMGLKNTRWGRLTIILFGVWAVLTSVVCFEKPDFLNVSYFYFFHFFDSFKFS